MNEVNKSSLFERFRKWITGVEPQGVGTLLLGIGALVALWQTSDVMKTVLKIQNQAADIQRAVELLGAQLVELKAMEKLGPFSPTGTSPSKEALEQAIRTLPTEPRINGSTVYLPKEKVNETIDQLKNAKTTAERVEILRKNLEYKSK